MKFGTIFGGDVDTRVFLYGNPDERNRIRYSAPEDGIPSVEYFPTFNQLDVGPKNFAVTDLTRQYDRLLVTTNKPEAYYCTIGTLQLDENRTESSVQTFPLNEAICNILIDASLYPSCKLENSKPFICQPRAMAQYSMCPHNL